METPPSTPSTPSRHSSSEDSDPPPSPIIDLGFDLGIDELLDEEIRDFIDYNPISPPTTSPGSTPPPRGRFWDSDESQDEEQNHEPRQELHYVAEHNTSVLSESSEPSVAITPVFRRRFFTV